MINSKLIKLVKDIVFYIFIIIMFLTSLSMIKSKQSGEVPNLFGYEFYNILTGSMEPTIPTGSLVITKSVDTKDIKVNDIITFGEGNSVTTHRVESINKGNNLEFITKGDANEVIDPRPIEENEIFGKVILHIIGLGYVIGFIQKNIILSIVIAIVLTTGFKMIKRYYNKNKNVDNTLEKREA